MEISFQPETWVSVEIPHLPHPVHPASQQVVPILPPRYVRSLAPVRTPSSCSAFG